MNSVHIFKFHQIYDALIHVNIKNMQTEYYYYVTGIILGCRQF